MSSLRFPVIQTKKTLIEEEDYNFVNKDKKKKTSTGNPMELIEELKRKIDQQKKQIDNRNITIQGLQRNFQSLSVIVKTEKAQSAALRAQLQSLKQSTQSGDKRATQFHQKCIMLERENKSLKEELKSTKKAHSQCGQFVTMTEQFKRKITALQENNQKLHSKLIQSDTDRKVLQIELGKFKSVEKDKRLLNERIIDLEEQLKKLSDTNNALVFKNSLADEEAGRFRNEIASRDKKIQEMKMRVKESQKQKQRLQFEIDYLKKQNSKLSHHIQESQKVMENKDLYSRLKSEEQDKIRRQYRALLLQHNQLEQVYKQTLKESQEKGQMIDFAHKEIERLKLQSEEMIQDFTMKENNYQKQIQKLTKSIKQLHEQLNMATGQFSSLNSKLKQEHQKNQHYGQKMSNLHQDIQEMNQQMQQHQSKYGHYLKLIAENQPDVIITNQREMSKMENSSAVMLSKYNSQITQQEKKISELQTTVQSQTSNIETMRKYIKSLEDEVSHKSQELLDKTRTIRKYEQQQEELNKMVQNERKNAERLKRQAEQDILNKMKQLEHQKLKSQKQIEDERSKLQWELNEERKRNAEQLKAQQQKLEKNAKMLEEYRREEQKLKQMMSKEQQEIARTANQKQQEIKRLIKQKEEELEREKKNNKMLWSDNKKLKDLENKLREDSNKLIVDKEQAKKEEIQRLKRQLQRKYKEEMNNLKGDESNANELKKILLQKSNQFKLLTEEHNKLKAEGQFYKNRNKQLEALISRLEKQFADKTSDLERENKSNKQVIEVFDKKLKEAEAAVSQADKKQKKELKYLYDQIEEMKKREKNNRVEEKLALVNKSMNDLQTSLKTLRNTMSCNYCVEVVKECVRLECGHIYCKKCKAGYEPNCGECKKKSAAVGDKMIDDTVSKASYMSILINTIKDDLSKISQ